MIRCRRSGGGSAVARSIRGTKSTYSPIRSVVTIATAPASRSDVRELVLLVARVDEQGADSRESTAEQDVHVVEAVRHQHRDGVAACDPEPGQGRGHALGRGQHLGIALAGLREHDGVGAASTRRLPNEHVAERCCLYPAARPGLAHSGSTPLGWAER